MTIKQKIVNIDDQPYIINAFVGEKGFKLLARLSKYATPIIGALSQASVSEDSEEDIDLTPVLQNLFFDGTDDFTALVFDLIRDVEKDGQKINIDKEFQMRYVPMLMLVAEVVKFNYSDVFQKLGLNLE
jgi:hypothetical protein